MVLTLFSEPGCSGKAVICKDREVNLTKVGVNFPVKSARVDGNPWILFSEERYQGFLAYLEEGSYGDLPSLGLPANYRVASAKLKADSVSNPQITLFNASNFKDENSKEHTQGGMNGHANGNSNPQWWSNGDQKLNWMSVGVAGLWAVTPDGSVLYREGTGHGEDSVGTGWSTVKGKMRNISVGSQTVWGLNRTNEVFVRIGLKPDDPKGKEWTKIDGSMTDISVGRSGVCWAVDPNDAVWRRVGAKETNSVGTKWQSVTGKLKHISVGQSGVWGLSPKNEVMYRDQTYGLPGEADGTGWTKVDGMMVWISSGENIVWGLSANGELWYRAGIDQNNPMGTNWFKLNTSQDYNVEWKMVGSEAGSLWGIDNTNKLSCRENAIEENIIAGNAVNLYDDNGNFKCFNIQEKPSSYVVLNGGWVIYSNANFKGKQLYHHDGDCFSNDPSNPKGPKLKSWQDPIGSVRPMRGLDLKLLSVTVKLDWEKKTTEHQTEVVDTKEEKNNTFGYVDPTWDKFQHVEAKLSHSFVLSQPVEGAGGSSFSLEGIPKEGITFATQGNKLETGLDFRQELSNMFTFNTETSAVRERTKKEVMKLPPNLPPMHLIKVSTVIHKGIIKMPFTATFTSGNSTWSVPGTYSGVDSTQIKVEFSEVCLRGSNKKFSRV